MMKVLSFAALILLFALPAHAQSHATQVSSAPSAATVGGGGAGSIGGGGYGSSFGFSTAYSTAVPVHYQYSFARGSDSSFVPSTFVSFADAVKMGEAALVPPPPVSIAQVAAEYRAQKQHTN
jgi:hypothetical protein